MQGKAAINKGYECYEIGGRLPSNNVRIELNVNYKEPGTILDSTGVTPPLTGSQKMWVTKDGTLYYAIWDPSQNIPNKDVNGWNVLKSVDKLIPGSNNLIAIELKDSAACMWIGTKLQNKMSLTTTLAPEPIYIGYFPANYRWRFFKDTGRSMIGKVDVTYWGTLDPDLYALKKDLSQ